MISAAVINMDGFVLFNSIYLLTCKNSSGSGTLMRAFEIPTILSLFFAIQ